MKSNPWSIVSLGVLVFATWLAVGTFSRMPAFNRALQVEAVGGGPYPALRSAMYTRGAYLYQIAFDWRAKTASEILRGGLEDAPSQETILFRSRQARGHLVESLKTKPANAYAWTLLASTEIALGDREAAFDALRKSQELAPFEVRLAFRRLVLLARDGESLDRDGAGEAAFPPGLVAPNVAVLRAFDQVAVSRLKETYPSLVGLFDAAESGK